MNLQTLALEAGGRMPQTHAERLMAMSLVPPSAMVDFLENLPKQDAPGWMRTLMEIGALDLGSSLEHKFSAKEGLDVCEDWEVVVAGFMGLVGHGGLALPPINQPNRHIPRFFFLPNADVVGVFEEATQRLVDQAALVRDASCLIMQSAEIPGLDSHKAFDHPAARGLSHWAGMACLLGRHEALKVLLDAYPESMALLFLAHTKRT